MELRSLLRDLSVERHAGPEAAQVTGVVEDSRRVKPGDLFVARSGGATDGRQYISDAVSRGAAAVLTDQPVSVPEGVVLLIGREAAALGVELAERLHDRPGRRLRLIGVTGTNGKTTTAHMIRHLMAAAGHRCGMIGTVEVHDGQQGRPAALTTPGAIELIGLLGSMADHGCDSCVMEVSSHALDQGRVEPLQFDAAVFTNLSGDHLDYHGTMEAYAAAKARLFEALPEDAAAVVNADDDAADRMVRDCGGRVLRYGLGDAAASEPGASGHAAAGPPPEVRAEILAATARRTECVFAGPWGRLEAGLPVSGRHNVANMAAALTALHGLGLNVAALDEAVAACPPVPGRLEPVQAESGVDTPFEVLVDYAHTDDALANVLQALRPVTRNRLRVLFGCGGDRDATKRPRMAAAASDEADDLLITSDNPRTEDPEAIIQQIVEGVPSEMRQRVTVEPDRAAAIRRIVAEAEPGDVVLIAGKGHEDYQIVGTERHDFDDRVHARRAVESRLGNRGDGGSVGEAGAEPSKSIEPGQRASAVGG